MRDANKTETSVIQTVIPTAMIRDARAVCGDKSLSFEILFESSNAHKGFNICAGIANSNWQIKSVNYRNNGCFFLQLLDDGITDPEELGCYFDNDISILRWTNAIGVTF